MPSNLEGLRHARIGQVLTPFYTSLTMLLPDRLPQISVCLMQLQCTVLHVCLMHINQYMFVIPLNEMTRLG